MTIFLTTQYLEEADELADRVGIISSGRLEAEGSPAELKKTIGTDTIVADVDGSAEAARSCLAALPGVESVEIEGAQIRVSSASGASVIADVAVVLKENAVPVTSLTLRTPTLDDVFLQVTGSQFDGAGEDTERTDGGAP